MSSANQTIPPDVLHILAINPGSTSTKVALFDREREIFSHTVEHEKRKLAQYATTNDQMDMRRQAVAKVLTENGHANTPLHAVVGRGGLLAPMRGGAWCVNQKMLDDLASAQYGEHPCNLGAPLALEFARKHNVEAVIVDPVVTDEMDSIARISGLPELPRRSIFHALSHRASARHAAAMFGTEYEKGKFLVCHMGGGISVAAHRYGNICDVVNALDGDGPFTPERTGRLAVLGVLDLLNSGKYDYEELRRIILREGGLWAHLGTNDLREVTKRMESGDEQANVVFNALVYSIAKELCGLAPALLATNPPEASAASADNRPITAVVLTGGMAKSPHLTTELRRRLEWLAPVVVLPEVEEMQALASGCLRVLQGKEKPGTYTGTPADIALPIPP